MKFGQPMSNERHHEQCEMFQTLICIPCEFEGFVGVAMTKKKQRRWKKKRNRNR